MEIQIIQIIITDNNTDNKMEIQIIQIIITDNNTDNKMEIQIIQIIIQIIKCSNLVPYVSY